MGSKLATKILMSSTNFESYLPKITTSISEKPLRQKEINDAFFVSSVFKKGGESILSNYRPISVCPCFSKILERIVYNKLYAYLADNSILFNKQFGFRTGHYTEDALLELTDQTNDSFNDKSYSIIL